MKKSQLSLLALLICTFWGCLPSAEETVTLSFWTDRDFAEEGFRMVFINDTYIGEFGEDIVDPICDQAGLLNYNMNKSEDLHLSVYNEQGESMDLGFVNLFSVSTGIKIKPTEDSEIFVDRSLDDECTLVYLNWE